MFYGIDLGVLSSSIAKKPDEWIAAGLGSGYGSAVTSIDGSVYIQSYQTLYKLNRKGKLVWGRSLESSPGKYALVVDSAGNVYASGNSSFICSFDTNGNLRWQRQLSASVSLEGLGISETGDAIYVAGGNSSVGYVAKINSSTGVVVWSKQTSPGIEFHSLGVSSAAVGRLAVSGYISNGSTLDTTFAELNESDGSIRYQRRLSVGTSNYVFSQGIAYSPSGTPVVSGFLSSPRVNFLIGFDTNGNTSFSLRAASSSGGYIYADYGTVAYDAAGYLYLSMYNLQNNYGPGQYGQWGTAYSRFSGSTLQKTVSFLGATGALRLTASKSDRTIGIMGTDQFIKVLGDDSLLTGTYGSFTVYEDPTDLTYSSSGISIYSDSISYTNPGLTSGASSYTVLTSGSQPTITYLG